MPDQYLAVAVGLLFITGLIMMYYAMRQRSADLRAWDTALVGIRAATGPRKSVGQDQPAHRL